MKRTFTLSDNRQFYATKVEFYKPCYSRNWRITVKPAGGARLSFNGTLASMLAIASTHLK